MRYIEIHVKTPLGCQHTVCTVWYKLKSTIKRLNELGMIVEGLGKRITIEQKNIIREHDELY